MGTQRTTTSTHCPPQPDEDVGWSYKHASYQTVTRYPMHINTFNGEAMLGKMEVSFEQWYHEVQCVKDHYPELVIWESTSKITKGGSGRYHPGTWALLPVHGPYSTKANHNLWHCGIIQCFNAKLYKVMQGNHEKVPSFTTRLEGTLNQDQVVVPFEDNRFKRCNSISKIISSTGVCKHIKRFNKISL